MDDLVPARWASSSNSRGSDRASPNVAVSRVPHTPSESRFSKIAVVTRQFVDARRSDLAREVSAQAFAVSSASPPYPSRAPEPPAAVEVVDGEEHFEVKDIVDSKLDRRFRVKLRYKLEWLGYENTDEQYTWVGADDVHAPELVDSFHLRYPDKPGPNY